MSGKGAIFVLLAVVCVPGLALLAGCDTIKWDSDSMQAGASGSQQVDMALPEGFGGFGAPFPDSDRDISYRIQGDSVKVATALEYVGDYRWYLGGYTEQDFANLTDATVMSLYDTLLDDKEGKSAVLTAGCTGQLGLILVIFEGQKISRKYYQAITVGKTDRVFVHSHQDGPDSNPNYMYFAVRVRGSSSAGGFRQAVPNGYAYARDLHFQSSGQKYSNFNGSEVEKLCSTYGICVGGYNDKTGFTDEAGASLEFPFYFGDDNFRVAMNNSSSLRYTFDAFVIRDTTVQDTGIFGGGFAYPAFVVMSSSNRLSITIPLREAGKEYDPKRHRNIALVTVDFQEYDGKSTGRPVITLDGFVER